MNNIKPPRPVSDDLPFHRPPKVQSRFEYRPTMIQKMNAFRKVFQDELKNTFLFRK